LGDLENKVSAVRDTSTAGAPSGQRKNRVVLSSLGAREHYELAAMLHRHGHLARLITDFWAPPIPQTVRKLLPRSINRLAGRRREDIPGNLVRSLPRFGIQYSRLQRNTVRESRFKVYEEEGARFALLACEYLETPHEAFFGFTSASLECLKYEKERGRWTVLDQIDPGPVEARLVRAEEKEYPKLNTLPGEIPESYFERVRQEWELASTVLVNSHWSKSALVSEGVPPAKIQVVPLPFRPTQQGGVRSFSGQNLKVLFLGTLCLRKGIHYALDAAKRLVGERVTFTFAGPSEVDIAALDFPSNATYVGQIPRSCTAQLFLSHDVFLFPTLSDGFGLAQLEAMAYGLPVIATHRCGDVVEHMKSGFVVPARDAASIVDALKQILDTRSVLSALSEAALRRSTDFLPGNQWPLYRQALCLGK
jgi:glycosyltransferase involved in cell wall biosynthesis